MSSEIEKVQVSDVTCDQLMDEAAAELTMLNNRAEHTISVVVQSIRTQLNIEKGKILFGLREKLSSHKSGHGMYQKFLKHNDIRVSAAAVWINAYELFIDKRDDFGDSFLFNNSINSLDRTFKLPEPFKTEVLAESNESGVPISRKSMNFQGKKSSRSIL